jgi:hypothetical protein
VIFVFEFELSKLRVFGLPRNHSPAIAQLVERLTVEVKTQLSGGPWFDSVLPDYFYTIY